MASCSRLASSLTLLAATLVVTLSVVSSTSAQPLLEFKRVEVQFPRITLAYKVTCDSTFRRDLGPQHFEVRENGLLMKNVTVWCPETENCCVSVSLVFDRSGSMEGTKIRNVKAGATKFVDLMNTPCDEASIVTFADGYDVDVPMSTHKPDLRAAIDRMTAYGRTALWDATGEGIRQLMIGARNRCKAVVVLSDGGDNASHELNYVDDVITLALANGVKVFTIGYGLRPGSPEEEDLKRLAAATGGQYYYSPNGDNITALYTSIKDEVQKAYRECLISYESTCPDGMLRYVELTLKNYCNTASTTQAKTYFAPLDRSKFQKVDLRLGEASGMGTTEVEIPVLLDTPVNGIFSRGNFSVIYDRRFAQLMRVHTNGALLDGTSLTMNDIGSGHTIFINGHTEISGSGPLCFLRFRLADVAARADVQVWLYNWNMERYCLEPQLQNGLLTVFPREPLLACDADVPDRIAWDDDLRDYQPNPFVVSATIRNTGTREARNLRARLIVPPSLDLVTPTTDLQTATPPVIYPGQTATVRWELRARKQENTASIPVCFRIESDNHAPIECCRDISLTSAQEPALTCALTAPDTIYFREQYYEPEEIDVQLEAVNTGSGRARDIGAQLLQDTRFTIRSAATLDLATVMEPGGRVSGTFRVRMHPRATDGYDTLRVNVQGSDTDPAWCERPVFVQRVRVPRFALTCGADPDSLVFSELTGGYLPNPFTVSTTAENIGETYAEECQLMFVGPPRFTPLGSNLRPLGTMQVRDARTERWQVRALPRSTGGWDTLHFQVLGRGGLGRAIVVADCFVPVYVPAMRAPAYALDCSAPAALVFDRGSYVPDPFPFTLRIRNTGTATGRGLRPAIVLPQGVTLAPGETAIRTLDALSPDSTVMVTWMLTPQSRTTGGSEHLCARIADSSALTGECCTDVFIPRSTAPALTLDCAAIDTLAMDRSTGEYLGNPFEVTLTIRNTGSATAERVTVSLLALGTGIEVLDARDLVVGDLAPGLPSVLRWRVRALPRATASDALFEFRVRADNHADRMCARTVHIPARLEPVLDARCTSTPEDSLFFDWSVGDFAPPVMTVALTVRNSGGARATGVSAMLVVPEGMVLADGEVPDKAVVPAELGSGDEGRVSWRVRAQRDDTDRVRLFRFSARAANARDAECVDALWVQGSPREVTVWLPQHLLLAYGQKEWIPVMIDRTIGKDLSRYDLDFRYDPEVITLHAVGAHGTLTALGWTGPRLDLSAPGRARISDYTTSTPLRADTGALVMLSIEGTYRGRAAGGEFGRSVLALDPVVSVLNFGGIALRTRDGDVTVTDDCLQPLVAAEGVVLEANRPNPFNPTTVISYVLPAPDHVRLAVYDPVGREVLIADSGPRSAGRHSVRVDASGLRSGPYFYRLEYTGGAVTRAMLVAR